MTMTESELKLTHVQQNLLKNQAAETGVDLTVVRDQIFDLGMVAWRELRIRVGVLKTMQDGARNLAAKDEPDNKLLDKIDDVKRGEQ